MASALLPIPAPVTGLLGFVFGAGVGKLLVHYATWSLSDDSVAPAPSGSRCASRDHSWQWLPIVGLVWPPRRCVECGRGVDRGEATLQLGTGFLFSAFVVAYFHGHCQQTNEVRPDLLWYYGRCVYHLILISLLVAATATDLKECVIPDRITFPGIAIAVVLATVSGDLQLIHLWVDWNQPHADLLGPGLPDWIRLHRHWHGLAWSVAGLLVGAGLMWLVQCLSRITLRQEGIGLGDVILMAMIGGFIGWQSVLVVFLLAPLCGLLVGLLTKLLLNRPYVPYGPYLALATVVVLTNWRRIWLFESSWCGSIRHLFGDWKGLAILGAAALAAMSVMLVLLRFYRLIPGKTREESSS